jgi:glycosyltransferase involved in cell wall biosynthesis
MKITFLTPHINISGGVKIILEYADRLTKRGHKVTVICPQPTLVRENVKGIPIIYPKRAIMNLLGYKPDWVDVAADIKYVPSWNEKYIPNADIVVATAWQTASYVNDYSKRKGKKIYLIMHYEKLFHANNMEELADETYRYSFKKIVISTWLKKIMKQKYNSNSYLIVVPVDFDQFYPIRSFYGQNKRICMLHHTSAWKGVNDGIAAFNIAKKKYPNLELVMFGVQNKQIEINCEYYKSPVKGKLREIFNSCDIFVCPSWKEGLGMPAMEAMACKCALVTTDNGGCRDYAIHGKTALVSPSNNPEALAKNLIMLLEDERLLATIAQNGYEHIKQFTWDKAVNKMEKVFLKSLQEK